MIVRVELSTMSDCKVCLTPWSCLVMMFVVVWCLALVLGCLWSELLMTSVISCPLWSSVYECQRVECKFTFSVRTECGMFVMYCMQCCNNNNIYLKSNIQCI